MNNKSSPKVSYQQWLDLKIKEIRESGSLPRLLLHSCCASCSSYVLEYLSPYFLITVFFYNPNIYPEDEYEKRLEDQIRLLKELPLNDEVGLIVGDYRPDVFYQRVEGLEQEKEGQARCVKCYELRLEKTAQKAAELGFPYFTTTLTISPHKNSETINELGGKISNLFFFRFNRCRCENL